jgi:protoporphyrinogen oxidase
MADHPILILGTGMAALGAASRLEAEDRAAILYDANLFPGGHTATFDAGQGFLFDDGPHVSFTKHERIRDLLAANVDGAFEEVRARINNYWHGSWIPHPVQMNLHGLPTDLVVDIIRDFVAVHSSDQPEIGDYEAWLRAAYGNTFAETFPMVYGHKYHTTTMDRLTTDWLGPRMYRPSLDEVLRGALAPTNADVHYVTSFRYPTNGGFQAYLHPLLERLDVRLGRRVCAIDTKARVVGFADGATAAYARLVSSIPLPDLVPMISGAPPGVLAAAARLSFSSAIMVNLGVAREDVSDAHISYVYDEDIIFPRLNFPHLLSPNNVPPGTSSIQAELYFSDRYRPLTVTPETLIDDVVRDLQRIGILRENDRLPVQEARFVRYANVIYDHERAAAVAMIHDYLAEVGIARCGRYGDWDHAWTDESFISGELAADQVLAGT